MFNKLIDPYPKLSYLAEDELDFSPFSAVAVPVFPSDEIKIIKSRFITALVEFTKLDLNMKNHGLFDRQRGKKNAKIQFNSLF